MTLRISHSQLQTFDRCAFSWHITYEKELVPIDSKSYFDFGNVVHKLLQIYYDAHKNRLAIDKCWDEVAEYAATQIALAGTNMDALSLYSRAIRLVRRYITEFAVHQDKGWTTLGVEYHFVIPLRTPGGIDYELEGYIDWIAEDPTGRIWIIDHKTVGNKFWTENELMMDPQMPFYEIGLRGLGKNIFGIQVNMLNSYDYKDFESVDREKLFRRLPSYRNPHELEKIVEEMGLAVDAMEATRLTNIRRRSLKRDCSQCQHQELCLIDLKGIPIDGVVEARYKDKDFFGKSALDINAPL